MYDIYLLIESIFFGFMFYYVLWVWKIFIEDSIVFYSFCYILVSIYDVDLWSSGVDMGVS